MCNEVKFINIDIEQTLCTSAKSTHPVDTEVVSALSVTAECKKESRFCMNTLPSHDLRGQCSNGVGARTGQC